MWAFYATEGCAHRASDVDASDHLVDNIVSQALLDLLEREAGPLESILQTLGPAGGCVKLLLLGLRGRVVSEVVSAAEGGLLAFVAFARCS